jgi:hypothetical protein
LGAGLAHAERLSFGDHDDGVVEESRRLTAVVLGQQPSPLVEGPAGANAEGAALAGGGDEPEQQLGAGVIERGNPTSSVRLAKCANPSLVTSASAP